MNRGVELAEPQVDKPTFRMVCCKDVRAIESDHPLISDLVSTATLRAYCDFPGASADFPLFAYLESNDEVASFLRLIPDEVTIDRLRLPWAWTGDNFTFPPFRKRGLSTLLQRQTTQYLHQKQIGRGSVFSTDVTLHTFEKLGFTFVGYAPRYLLLRTADPLVAAHIRGRARSGVQAVLRPAAAIAMASVRGWTWLRRTHTNCEVTTPDDPRLSNLLNRTGAKCDIHFDLNMGVMRQKLEMAGRHGKISLRLILDELTGEPIAYFVTRERFQKSPLAEKYKDFELMTLLDFAFADGDQKSANAVAAHLLRVFFQSSNEVLELISSNLQLNRAAARRGLLRVGRGMSFCYSLPSEWNLPKKLAVVQKWPLTHFRGDGFSF